ncbi:hypothetical protein BDN72DRAFT_861981 [Pluteus cervinus]|uniref:Uncharacterized protein n=1 Tax=Pluteus cervinus TaxID=181527 RepID=A0ACD3ADZ9_9AGAR|nr:hypothetical protein BDN72DRAFT_861981 [Pluteus cervinus]
MTGEANGPIERPPDMLRGEAGPDDIDVIEGILPSAVDDEFIDQDPRPHRANSVELTGSSERDNLNFKKAHSILQQAWLLAVRYNATFVVISDGNRERIGIRHRNWAALFLSRTITLGTEPEYYKSHVGLYLASRSEAITRFKLEMEAAPNDILQQGSPADRFDLETALAKINDILIVCGERRLNCVKHLEKEHQKLCVPPKKRKAKNLPGYHHRKLEELSPYPRTNIIGSGVFYFETLANPTFFSHAGRIEINGHPQMSNLVLRFGKGQDGCRDLCKYYRRYERLSLIVSLRLPRHYGLFQWNGYSDDGLQMALIAENPGDRLEAYIDLKRSQKESLKKQLECIHEAGYLHGGIELESIYVGMDGRRVHLLGFENTRKCNDDPIIAFSEKNNEKAQLQQVLGETATAPQA